MLLFEKKHHTAQWGQNGRGKRDAPGRPPSPPFPLTSPAGALPVVGGRARRGGVPEAFAEPRPQERVHTVEQLAADGGPTGGRAHAL